MAGSFGETSAHRIMKRLLFTSTGFALTFFFLLLLIVEPLPTLLAQKNKKTANQELLQDSSMDMLRGLVRRVVSPEQAGFFEGFLMEVPKIMDEAVTVADQDSRAFGFVSEIKMHAFIQQRVQDYIQKYSAQVAEEAKYAKLKLKMHKIQTTLKMGPIPRPGPWGENRIYETKHTGDFIAYGDGEEIKAGQMNLVAQYTLSGEGKRVISFYQNIALAGELVYRDEFHYDKAFDRFSELDAVSFFEEINEEVFLKGLVALRILAARAEEKDPAEREVKEKVAQLAVQNNVDMLFLKKYLQSEASKVAPVLENIDGLLGSEEMDALAKSYEPRRPSNLGDANAIHQEIISANQVISKYISNK